MAGQYFEYPATTNPAVGQGSTTSGQSGILSQGAVTTAAPTYTSGQTDPLSLDTAGNLRVTGTFTPGAASALATASTTGTSTAVTSGSVVVAANSARNALYLVADPNNTVTVRFVLASSGSSATSFPLTPGSSFTIEPVNGKIYTGAVYMQAEDGTTSSNVAVIEL